MQTKRNPTGIRVRHSRSCPGRNGGKCGKPCRPSYEAFVYAQREGQKIRKTFATLSEAKAWRAQVTVELHRGSLRAPSRVTIREAAKAWLEGAKDGSIRNRSGDVYKPSVLRGYEHSLLARILPQIGGARLSELTRADVQAFADRLLSQELDPSTIRNTLMPLRAICRRALGRDEIAVNPTTDIELSAVRGRRDRIASPEQAAALIAALSTRDQPLWGTAFYAGLRRGELRALRWEDVDLEAGVIHVERSMDDTGEVIAPKSAAGVRKVPIPKVLRELLIEHKLACSWSTGYVFGSGPTNPFTPSAVRRRAATAWRKANEQENERAENEGGEPDLLQPLGLHEARHTFASLMIAAGVNAKALSTYMGHSSVTITLDRYGHLMPGNEEEAAELLDRYLERSAGSVGALAAD